MSNKQSILCPIRNFAEMGHKLFRGAQPLYSYEYKFLIDKGISQIINLRSELSHDDSHSKDFTVHNIPVPDHKPPTNQDVKKFVEIIKKGEKTFFHCEHGRGRTSTFAVIARMSMGWSLERSLKEEKDKFGYEFQHPSQLEFLKNLDISLLLLNK